MKPRQSSGFTLLEMLVVIMIIALVTTIAGVNMRNRANGDLQTIGRTLVSDLRYVRSRALIGSTDTTLTIDVAKGMYFSDPAAISRTLPEKISVVLTIDEQDISGTQGKIYFYPDGSSSGGNISLKTANNELHVITTWLNGHVALKNKL
jgi:general secretion pathway protein H